MQVSHLLEIGLKRRENEDNLFYHTLDQAGIFALADGMGGHGGGKEASTMAMSIFVDIWRENAKSIKEKNYTREHILKIMKYGFDRANYEIYHANLKKGTRMGTTLSVAVCIKNQAFIMHIGDSRVYWLDQSELNQVTDDDTKSFSDMKNGFISKAYYEMNSADNRLVKCIGLKTRISPQFYEINVSSGDQLLLCSDGVHQYMNSKKILAVLTHPHLVNVDEKLQNIKRDVDSQGASDNYSAILVQI